jgi:tryptophanyl-tRNA synthetase
MHAHISIQSKTASPEATSDERLGLFAYPVLQAADILLYKYAFDFPLYA